MSLFKNNSVGRTFYAWMDHAKEERARREVDAVRAYMDIHQGLISKHIRRGRAPLGEKVNVASSARRGAYGSSVGEKKPAKSTGAPSNAADRAERRRVAAAAAAGKSARRRAAGFEDGDAGDGRGGGRGSPVGWTRGWRPRLESPIDPGCESHAPAAGRGDLSCWHFYLTDCEAETPPGHQLFSCPATQSRAARLGRVGGTFDPSPVRPRVSLAFEASSDARASAVERRKVSAADNQCWVRIFAWAIDTKKNPPRRVGRVLWSHPC